MKAKPIKRPLYEAEATVLRLLTSLRNKEEQKANITLETVVTADQNKEQYLTIV
jgi:hypothetical protein